MKTILALVAALILPVALGLSATIQDVVNTVSYDSYRSYLGYPGDTTNPLFTQEGNNRYYTSTQHDLARTNIFNMFSGFGLTTSYSNFSYGNSTYSNVVAVKTGTVRPNDIYILGAHFDSASPTCPGADDNASGVAGILEAARVFSLFNFEATVQFIAFDLEELGLIGSTAYAADAKTRGDNILGMVSLDMIACNTGGNNSADIWGHTASDPMKNALADAVRTYGGLTVSVGGAMDYSDQAPFEWNGYQAALLIEPDGNTRYHQPSDNVNTVGYLDYTYATSMTKGAVGYAATYATVVPEPGTIWLLFVGVGFCWRFVRRQKLGDAVHDPNVVGFAVLDFAQTRKVAPSFLPRRRQAPPMAVARKTMAQTPRALARNLPSPGS